MKTLIVIILMNTLISVGGKIKINTPTRMEPIRYMKETFTEIASLTKENTVEIEVTGPTWLKVNTRLPWHKDMEGEESYTIIVQEDSVKETIFKKKTYLSKEIFGRNNRRYGESRYSLINVPEGKHTYIFFFWSAKPETILLDFSFASPSLWTEIIPSSYSSTLTLIGAEERQTYYTISQDSPLEIKVTSPINIKVLTRLNFDKTLKGRKGYTIIVKDNDEVFKVVSFVAEKSDVYDYDNRKDLIPSKENRFFLWFARGNHTLTFHLEGTEAKTGAICFLKETKSK
ncbi:MAG: hypothetical protein E3J87_05155 [Candidatus Cloacimonadota bacterium]|nr:MAG: hypothetical protein E3J87_05155 [Candidatus Cloacimonadota bacterium]